MTDVNTALELVGADERAKIVRPKFSTRDLLGESFAALAARPARTMLTALGTVLGVAALVATLGLAKTAGSQIITSFNELAATKVVVEPASSGFGNQRASTIPWDAGDRLKRLNGVAAAATKSSVSNEFVRSVPVVDPLGNNEQQLPLIASSGDLLGAVRGTLATGRFFDDGHSERRDRVAVLGEGAAARLNVNRVGHLPVIFIRDQAFTVIGILEDVEREPDLLSAIIIPDGVARERFGLTAPKEVHVDIDVGASELIGFQAPIALNPNRPDLLKAKLPSAPRGVRQQVEDDVNALFLVLGGVSLLVGALGIANVTLVSVLERVGEIGLRRAVGGARRHIAAQFLLESSAIGLIGGIVGTSLGVLIVVGYAAMQSWTPVIDNWLLFAAPIAGAFIGLLSGLYPSWRASSIEPIAALRTSI